MLSGPNGITLISAPRGTAISFQALLRTRTALTHAKKKGDRALGLIGHESDLWCGGDSALAETVLVPWVDRRRVFAPTAHTHSSYQKRGG